MYRDESLEKKVLAYLLKDLRYLSIAQQTLRPEFFDYPFHTRIFKAIQFAYSKWHTTMDYEIFEKKFIKKSGLESEEKMDYLVLFKQLLKMEVDDSKFTYYIDSLKDLKIKREMQNLVSNFGKKLEADDNTGEELVSQMVENIHKIRLSSDLVTINKGFVYDNIEERIKWYDVRKKQGDVPGIPYGWAKLDELTGGHFNQELIVIMSRTGGGKTRVMHNFAYNANVAKAKVLYVTIEMSGGEISRLYDSRLCKLHYEKIKKGKLSQEEEDKWKSILTMMEQRKKKGFYVVDIPQGCTVDTIEQEVYDYEKRFGKLDTIFVDYLQLIKSTEKGLSKTDQLGDITQRLKQLARAKNISVITATQANREALKVESGTDVGTEHIAASDQIGQNANMVLYLFRTPEDKMKNTMKVNIVKYRDGGGLWFEVFADWSRNYIGDAVWELDVEKEKKK